MGSSSISAILSPPDLYAVWSGPLWQVFHYTTHTARPRVDLKPGSNKAISSLNLSSNCSGPMDDDRLPEQLCTQKHFLKFTSRSLVHDMWMKGTDRKSWATICVLISKLGWNWGGFFWGETFLTGHCMGTLMEVKPWESIIQVNVKLWDEITKNKYKKVSCLLCFLFSYCSAVLSSDVKHLECMLKALLKLSRQWKLLLCLLCDIYISQLWHANKGKKNCSLMSKSWAVSLSVAR